MLLQARFLAYNSPKNRLAAGLCPDPLGELEQSPRPSSRKTGGLLLRGGERKKGKRIGWEGSGKEGTGKERRGREGRGNEGGKREGMGKREGDVSPLTQILGSAPGDGQLLTRLSADTRLSIDACWS